jgi:hypothetical protein
LAMYPSDRTSLLVAKRTDASSSMIEITQASDKMPNLCAMPSRDSHGRHFAWPS